MEIYRNYRQYFLLFIPIIVLIIGLMFNFIIYIITGNKELYDILNSYVAGFISLVSSFIALTLPFILKKVSEDENLKKEYNKREKGFSAFKDLCDFYFEQWDSERNIPKDNIEVRERTKMISQVETLYTYKKEIFPLGIIISSGWKDVEGNHSISIHSREGLDIRIRAHDFGKIKKIELKYQGNLVMKEDEDDIQLPLQIIKKRIETLTDNKKKKKKEKPNSNSTQTSKLKRSLKLRNKKS